MKFIVFFSYLFTFASITLSQQSPDHIVGFSSAKIRNYFVKAVLGFRDIIRNGDEELGYPVMDPYNIGNITWNGGKKFAHDQLHFFGENTTLTGLSKYQFRGRHNHFIVNPKDLSIRFVVAFDRLILTTPYKLDGYLLKNGLPLYGAGNLMFETHDVYFFVNMTLSLQESRVGVHYISTKLVNVVSERTTATGLLDLPEEFYEDFLNEILNSYYESMNINGLISNHARKVVEDAIGGMTMSEVFELTDYFASRT